MGSRWGGGAEWLDEGCFVRAVGAPRCTVPPGRGTVTRVCQHPLGPCPGVAYTMNCPNRRQQFFPFVWWHQADRIQQNRQGEGPPLRMACESTVLATGAKGTRELGWYY